MTPRPKKLLDQVRACPELVEGMQCGSSAMPTAPRVPPGLGDSHLPGLQATIVDTRRKRGVCG
jgi:hypothetical protein